MALNVIVKNTFLDLDESEEREHASAARRSFSVPRALKYAEGRSSRDSAAAGAEKRPRPGSPSSASTGISSDGESSEVGSSGDFNTPRDAPATLATGPVSSTLPKLLNPLPRAVVAPLLSSSTVTPYYTAPLSQVPPHFGAPAPQRRQQSKPSPKEDAGAASKWQWNLAAVEFKMPGFEPAATIISAAPITTGPAPMPPATPSMKLNPEARPFEPTPTPTSGRPAPLDAAGAAGGA